MSLCKSGKSRVTKLIVNLFVVFFWSLGRNKPSCKLDIDKLPSQSQINKNSVDMSEYVQDVDVGFIARFEFW